MPLFGLASTKTTQTTASVTSTTTTPVAHCTPFTLPSLGVITINADTTITLSNDVLFQPACTGVVDITQNSISSTLTDLRDPFYASTIPQCYALAATTLIAYTLFIMLLITPRTFLQGGAVILGRRGFTNGPTGEAGIGIGGRPWLQKVAAATVAISLTIASVDTFKVAQAQYEIGFMDATALQQQVLDGTTLKVMRIISDTFLWLAQAQTLIRLFPRQREKVIIKWTAFALILLDLIFGVLESFVVSTTYSRPTSFNEAIPALSYLFQLALGILYCAWVIYYSITKKQYAFYHPEMRNVCLVALLSIVSLFVPVVFFMTDIINHDVAAWGDYVRWVGAAAASVVVWEWVERIEALERNDKKDGVLGREVFDGDEMLEVTPASDVRRRRWGGGNGGASGSSSGAAGGNTGSSSFGKAWPVITGAVHRYRPHRKPRPTRSTRQELAAEKLDAPGGSIVSQLTPWPARTTNTVTPVSRADTASAESTVYAVRYHPIAVGTQPFGEAVPTIPANLVDIEAQDDTIAPVNSGMMFEKHVQEEGSDAPILAPPTSNFRIKFWDTVDRINPLAHRSRQPPAELAAHTRANSLQPATDLTRTLSPSHARWDIRGRLEDYASVQAERFEKKNKRVDANVPILPVTRIPAPPRNRTEREMADLIEEDERMNYYESNTVVGVASPPIQRAISQSRRPTGPSRMPSREGQVGEHLMRSVSGSMGTRSNTTRTPPNMVRSPTSRVVPEMDSNERLEQDLPVIRIPPPPRRRRTDEEDA